MIQFDKVSLSFSGHTLFQDVSFTLQSKERCGLVGRNGSGKSTLFRLIEGEMEPDKGNIAIPKNYKIGYLRQHIQFTQPTLIEEALLALPLEERDSPYKAEKILFGLGFTNQDLEKSPNLFSGGYHLRLHLAKVLISDPHCLLLDEPTNYLDILSIRWLQRFLARWPGEFILISHDRTFMDAITTHTMGIHREKVRKVEGSTLNFYNQIVSEEEIYEKTRIKTEKKRDHLQSYIDRFGAKASKAAQAQSKKKMLAREPILEKLNQLSALSFSFKEEPFPGKKLLEAHRATFSYTSIPLIAPFSLTIEKGEKVAIIGKNGRGKSTLLKLLAGELEPHTGDVVRSENVHLGYFGQTHVDRLHQAHTIEEEIAAANPTLNYTAVKGIAGLMMFGGTLSEKKIAVLSGGEKSRVLLGKIIATPCNLLLLDEPTHHLDMESIEALIDALEDFNGSLVIVTHSELILRRLALDKIILCEEKGQRFFLGNYDEFLEKIGWEEEKKATSTKKTTPSERRERAEWVAKRAAILKPIELEIAKQEERLSALETKQKEAEGQLNSGTPTPELLKTLGLRNKQLEELEAELYRLYALLDEKKKEWEL